MTLGAQRERSLTGVDYAGAFLDENRAFAELFRDADESTPVPNCPDWTLRQPFRHVGRGDRWAAQIVRDRLDSYLDPRMVEGGKPPPDPADAAIALGREFTLRPELAADAITEMRSPNGWTGSRFRRAARARRCRSTTPTRCTCTPPTPASARPASGPSRSSRAASPGRTSTARAALRCVVAQPICCWRSYAAAHCADTGAELFGDDAVWQRWLDRTPL
ncbi:hypothetical protein MLM_3984 [Mycobacterium lepraemurium]|nr:hypothetical protein MLM_3984 [Mycobacterium lepraemurium]